MSTGYHAELCGYDDKTETFEFNIHSDKTDEVLVTYDVKDGAIFDCHTEHDYSEITDAVVAIAEKMNLFALCEARYAASTKIT